MSNAHHHLDVASLTRQLATHDALREHIDHAHDAATRLRWHEALRRRWKEARDETSVLAASTEARCEGLRVYPAHIRDAIMTHTPRHENSGDTALDIAMGIWRAHARLTTMMAPLVVARTAQGARMIRPHTPAPMMMASIHRDVVSPLTRQPSPPHGLNSFMVGRLRNPNQMPIEGTTDAPVIGDAFTQRMENLYQLIDAPLGGGNALIRVALVHGEILAIAPFMVGNAAVARLMVRYLLERDGAEPTGCALTSLALSRAPGDYAAARAAYTSATPEGVIAWLIYQCQAISEGCEAGVETCRSIQAGTPLV